MASRAALPTSSGCTASRSPSAGLHDWEIRPHRHELLYQILFIRTGRAELALEAPGAHGARALDHVQGFRDLVEARFREQPALSVCAAELGITSTQLNRVCQQVLGHAALGVLHARLVLEAQRELAYTNLSVKQIAFDLGFTDAGYSTRFFQRRTGSVPTLWRAGRVRRRRATPSCGRALSGGACGCGSISA